MKIERERGRGFIKQSDASLDISNRVVEIVPVEESKSTSVRGKTEVELIKPDVIVPQSITTTLKDIFTQFLQLELGDGAASADTIRNYLSQTKQYLNWCRDNLLSPIEAEPEDIKLYRQHLVQSGYANSTIATKLNIVRIFYKAAQAHSLIANNPAAKVKAPKDRKDPAARITFMGAIRLV